ncbi:MAG: ACP S-malonyltransferase [Planctomycetaceae bacterium]|nr:ACP S-malonyltransferase [Planctomycetaceae bacterium]MCL2305271.1 ACP S-malonyltransferase [Planctomycetaceae bacterium]MCL2305404.1 ACP S-malonyltransferase [Planctomycetaceae bacterium]
MGKVAFLFAGQGAQTVGMGRGIFQSRSAVKALFEQANDLLGYDIARLCFEGPAEELDSTIHSQPAIFLVSIASLEILKEQEPQKFQNCQAAAGLSLGEYTALVFSGAIRFEDGLRLVQKRGQAMQEASDAVPSGMVSILGLELPQVEELCEKARGTGVLQVANILCPGNIVVSGTNEACERVAELARPAGAMKALPLAVAGAFHTPLMQPAVDKLAEALDAITIQPPRIPVISNVDAQPHTAPDEIRQILMKQILQPVQWEKSMRYLLEREFDQFFEIGPGRVLRGLLKRIERKVDCQGVDI